MTATSQTKRPGKISQWLYERLGLQGIAYAVPKHANSLPYILGGITLTGFIILIVTGIYLAQFYHPHPSEAHNSVVYIVTGVFLGDLVRSVHFWTAQIVTVTVLLHMGRVLVTGAFKRPREINWLVGLGLLAVTLVFVFTGSVLKFDQEGLEAFQHNIEGAELLGIVGAWFSSEFSRSAPLLTRLFNAHVTILPLTFGLLIAAHVFLIKQHGISPKVTADAKTRSTSGKGTRVSPSILNAWLVTGCSSWRLPWFLALHSPLRWAKLGWQAPRLPSLGGCSCGYFPRKQSGERAPWSPSLLC
jgi:quinol-cytochrome oxidoreductase complex cytochrome b subunit